MVVPLTPTASGVSVSVMLTTQRCGASAAAQPHLQHQQTGIVWTTLPYHALIVLGAGQWILIWSAPIISAPAEKT